MQSTPVWKEGLPSWVTAADLDELKGAYIQAPPLFKTAVSPPIPKGSVTEKIGYNIGKSVSWIARVGLLAIIVIFGILIYNRSHINPNPTLPFSSEPPIDPEHANPSAYLNATGTYHPNFWGNQEDINGVVKNNASHTNYKDIRIKVNFYTQTNTLISSKEYILYEFVPYGSAKNFSLKVEKPPAAASCGWAAIGGTYY